MSGRVVVYGGRGALGSTIVMHFKQAGWWVANVDMKTNELADENILVEGETWVQQVGGGGVCAHGEMQGGVAGGECDQDCGGCPRWREARCCSVHGWWMGRRISI